MKQKQKCQIITFQCLSCFCWWTNQSPLIHYFFEPDCHSFRWIHPHNRFNCWVLLVGELLRTHACIYERINCKWISIIAWRIHIIKLFLEIFQCHCQIKQTILKCILISKSNKHSEYISVYNFVSLICFIFLRLELNLIVLTGLVCKFFL